MTPTNAVEDTAKCCRIFLSSLDESLCFTEIKLDTRGTWKRTQLWWGITNKTISNGTCALRSLVGNPKSWRLLLQKYYQKSYLYFSSPIESLVYFFSRQLLQRERFGLQTTPAHQNQPGSQNNKTAYHVLFQPAKISIPAYKWHLRVLPNGGYDRIQRSLQPKESRTSVGVVSLEGQTACLQV